MKVKEFFIEESKVNKQCLILVAVLETGEKFVVSGDHHAPTFIIPYERAWDASEYDKSKYPR